MSIERNPEQEARVFFAKLASQYKLEPDETRLLAEFSSTHHETINQAVKKTTDPYTRGTPLFVITGLRMVLQTMTESPRILNPLIDPTEKESVFKKVVDRFFDKELVPKVLRAIAGAADVSLPEKSETDQQAIQVLQKIVALSEKG